MHEIEHTNEDFNQKEAKGRQLLNVAIWQRAGELADGAPNVEESTTDRARTAQSSNYGSQTEADEISIDHISAIDENTLNALGHPYESEAPEEIGFTLRLISTETINEDQKVRIARTFVLSSEGVLEVSIKRTKPQEPAYEQATNYGDIGVVGRHMLLDELSGMSFGIK